MKIYAPDYYNEFSCIADKCRHNCCIGWEIDIDDDTMELYNKIISEKTPLSKRLSDSIEITDGCPHFKLCENDRCPFLDSNGLCDLILEKGEDILCDICTDHPRFRNFYSDRTEIGLGLCCEVVADIVLSKAEPMKIVAIGDDGFECLPLTDYEKSALQLKDEILAILSDHGANFNTRAEKALLLADTKLKDFSGNELYDILLPLERLDTQWDSVISSLSKLHKISDLPKYDSYREKLSMYFIYRHLNAECDSFADAIEFSLFSVDTIVKAAIAVYGGNFELSQIADIARMYSAEIEYSTENIEKILFSVQNKVMI